MMAWPQNAMISQRFNPPLVGVHDRIWYADVQFRSMPNLIACAVLEAKTGLILVDPGPASTLDNLAEALQPLGGLHRVQHVLLTHIHLDHAGACGMMVRKAPHIQIHVHPVGTIHLIDPARLIRSAERIYGDRLDSLWGPILPVPAAQVRTVAHNEELNLDGCPMLAIHTPGHASHHVAWLDQKANVLFAGDAAGMRVLEAPLIIPVAPPPDIQVELWYQSLERIAEQEADQLFLTHFGPVSDVQEHISDMRSRLYAWSRAVRATLDIDTDDQSRAAQFHEQEMRHTRALVPPHLLAPYTIMGQPESSWYGLARYWRKKARR